MSLPQPATSGPGWRAEPTADGWIVYDEAGPGDPLVAALHALVGAENLSDWCCDATAGGGWLVYAKAS